MIGKRTPWSEDEKKVVETGLEKFFALKKLSGKHHCEEVLQKNQVLKSKTWTIVKDYVRNNLKNEELK
jgi:hypothetical protein